MKRLVLIVVVLSVVALLLAACGGSAPAPAAAAAAPAATAVPATAAPAAIAVPPTAAPAPTAAAPAVPEGWLAKSAGGVSVVLPKDWDLMDFSAGDMEKMYENLEKSNPDLAQLVGSADALQGIALWGFSPKRQDVDFVDNVNVRKQSLEGQNVDKLGKDLTDVVVDGLKQANFQDISATPDLKVGDRNAAYLTYTTSVSGAGGSPIKITIRQWMLLTPTDMWVMTYSAGPKSGLELNPAFEKQALNLEVQ